IGSRRLREAEMLVSAKGQHLITTADEDTFSIVSALDAPSKKYRHRVLLVAAEVARKTGHKDICGDIARRMESSDSPRERSDGKLMLGLLAMVEGRHQDAYGILTEARSLISSNGTNPRLECEIAEALANLSRYKEAKEVLESLLPSQLKRSDPEYLERIYFQLGTIHLREGNGAEALKCMSKSLGLTRSSDKAKFYRGLSDAYALVGMKEKSAEFASKIQIPKRWGSSSAGQYR
ncbi:MAG: tetratricopeptide repeat protein, partial [Euryarchaeota archaeon]|nr:tetratricopeptide repeat protein [Euryarchaeota archaeon]